MKCLKPLSWPRQKGREKKPSAYCLEGRLGCPYSAGGMSCIGLSLLPRGPVRGVTEAMPLPRSVKSFPLNRVCLSQEKNQRKKAWQRRYHQDSSLVISSGLFVIVEFMKFK